MRKFIEMKNKDIQPLREKIYKKNNGICPLLKINFPLSKASLDHNHKNNNEEYSENKGTIRDVIEFRANIMEGKISNSWKRLYGSKEEEYPISLPNFLRNLADFLEKPSYCEVIDGVKTNFIHPSEVPKEQKLSKRNYNKLKKLYDLEEFKPKRKNQKKPKFPEFPKSKKLTKPLKKLYERFNIEPYN